MHEVHEVQLWYEDIPEGQLYLWLPDEQRGYTNVDLWQHRGLTLMLAAAHGDLDRYSVVAEFEEIDRHPPGYPKEIAARLIPRANMIEAHLERHEEGAARLAWVFFDIVGEEERLPDLHDMAWEADLFESDEDLYLGLGGGWPNWWWSIGELDRMYPLRNRALWPVPAPFRDMLTIMSGWSAKEDMLRRMAEGAELSRSMLLDWPWREAMVEPKTRREAEMIASLVVHSPSSLVIRVWLWSISVLGARYLGIADYVP